MCKAGIDVRLFFTLFQIKYQIINNVYLHTFSIDIKLLVINILYNETVNRMCS